MLINPVPVTQCVHVLHVAIISECFIILLSYSVVVFYYLIVSLYVIECLDLSAQ